MRRRIGVVGCGRWGLKHLQALLNIQTVSGIDCIVACDTDANVLDSIHLNGIERHQHPETLVETFQLDAVIIATPDGSHYELGKQFLSQDVDVFVEKPLATTFDHASSLVSLSIEEGKILKSGFLLRFHPCIGDARSQIHAGRIGAIQSIRYCKKSRRSGNDGLHALDSLAIHGIDLAEFLLKGQTPLRISEVLGDRINSELTLEFPNQVEIHLDVGWEAKEDIAHLEILGANGRISIQLADHSTYDIDGDDSETCNVHSMHTPLEGVLLDFIEDDVSAFAASTGSILRTIKCVEHARSKLMSSGRFSTRVLKRCCRLAGP